MADFWIVVLLVFRWVDRDRWRGTLLLRFLALYGGRSRAHRDLPRRRRATHRDGPADADTTDLPGGCVDFGWAAALVETLFAGQTRGNYAHPSLKQGNRVGAPGRPPPWLFRQLHQSAWRCPVSESAPRLHLDLFGWRVASFLLRSCAYQASWLATAQLRANDPLPPGSFLGGWLGLVRHLERLHVADKGFDFFRLQALFEGRHLGQTVVALLALLDLRRCPACFASDPSP